ncbi:MAG: Fe-S cluster assembly protein SufD [Ginsengibacter sp.]
MEAITTDYLEDRFDELQSADAASSLHDIRKVGFNRFTETGLPSFKNEEWKYTFISNLFRKQYHLSDEKRNVTFNQSELDSVRLPGAENANELFFINGKYEASLSTIRSTEKELTILPLEEAAKGEYKDLVNEHLNKSFDFIKDGIHALNTSFIYGGIFILIPKNQVVENPIFFYHLMDTKENHQLVQPRSLIYVEKSAKVQLVETYKTIGVMDSFTNEVMEVVVEENAIVEYYKLQDDVAISSQVGTTHIRQIGKSYVHTVTISLNGGMIRNNIDIIMEAAGNEAHMYGLYLVKGRTHVDNHTLVDNTKPNCFSNEFYKGIIDENATGVFSGKIYVRPDAQKTNAYQSNKNILLSESATVNTKPQLEIFADDVKCSHGCTVGKLDEEALFYLRTRGISKENAQSMLLQAFASDIVSQIRPEGLRKFVEELIIDRLSVE